jgi:hypothetical protein
MEVQLTASVRGQLLSPAMGSVPQMVAKGDVKAEDATCKEIKVRWLIGFVLVSGVPCLLHGIEALPQGGRGIRVHVYQVHMS